MQSSSQVISTNKPTLNFLQAACPSCLQTNSVEALNGNVDSVFMILNSIMWL